MRQLPEATGIRTFDHQHSQILISKIPQKTISRSPSAAVAILDPIASGIITDMTACLAEEKSALASVVEESAAKFTSMIRLQTTRYSFLTLDGEV